MTRIILIQNGASETAVEYLAQSALKVKNSTITVIADQIPVASDNRIEWLSSTNSSISACIRRAAKAANEDRLMFMDARLSVTAAAMAGMAAYINAQPDGTFSYVPLSVDGELMELGDLGEDSLVPFLSSTPALPLMAIGISRDMILRSANLRGETLTEVLTELLVKSILACDEIAAYGDALKISAEMAATLTLSSAASARTLRTVVDSCNIEELFPQHNWSQHSKESAAACYHTLAATFIKFGDAESATECLKLGDTLEESPRSLALRGLIARERGEVLGAVANMISSLQQYELRKKNEEGESHYIAFEPSNAEQVESELRAGLAALNKRDNEGAMQHFMTAVFKFDAFYKDCGIEQ
ncbi:MAG: hypothetical protein K1X83_06605 [Oligoflexia bacterium]|nr:hypothetical protein [Oligoflexia bacterium]